MGRNLHGPGVPVSASNKRDQLRGIVEKIQREAEDLAVAAEVALKNYIVLDAAANGSDADVEAALRVIKSNFPERMPS